MADRERLTLLKKLVPFLIAHSPLGATTIRVPWWDLGSYETISLGHSHKRARYSPVDGVLDIPTGATVDAVINKVPVRFRDFRDKGDGRAPECHVTVDGTTHKLKDGEVKILKGVGKVEFRAG